MAHFATSRRIFRWHWFWRVIISLVLGLFLLAWWLVQGSRYQDASQHPAAQVRPERGSAGETVDWKEGNAQATKTYETALPMNVQEQTAQDEEMLDSGAAAVGLASREVERQRRDASRVGAASDGDTEQVAAVPEKPQEQEQVNRLRALSQIANLPIEAETFLEKKPLGNEQAEAGAKEESQTATSLSHQGELLSMRLDELLEINNPDSDTTTEDKSLSGRLQPPAPPPPVPLANVSPGGLVANDDADGFGGLDKGGLSLSEDFLQQRYNTQNLNFQAATGYWANTYVPGDPLLRRLHVRLKRQQLQLPDQDAQSIWQPFDAPQQAAMALFLRADKRAVQGQTRLLLQVGLKGTARHSGRRPAMNVGIVLDLRGTLDNAHSTLFRALLQALVQARQSDDQFILSLAGRAGGVLLQADDFRYGPLSLALPHLFGDAPAPNDTVLDLPQAIDATAAQLKLTDNPNAPLGSSLLLLLTSQTLGNYAAALQEQAHQYATAGIPFSAIGIGNQMVQEELEELVVLGQGHLRLLDRSSEAESLIDRELHAVSRVVARALRLNIRLQPGVKLIDVFGSQPLNTQRSEQMRQAERSIDQRLARNLGIERDRGNDEDGIQIIIPAFYANDSHTILLDVLAEKPGQIAEVSLRYKDLVYLRNGTTHAALSLGGEDAPRGPLELNVWKNLLALQLAETVKQAGEKLSQAETQQALALLENYQALLAQVQNQVLALQQDEEVEQDQHLLQQYVQLLRNPVNDPQARLRLADSLQYAGFAKVLQRPEQ